MEYTTPILSGMDILGSFLFGNIMESQSISLAWVVLQVFNSFGNLLLHPQPDCLPSFSPRGTCLAAVV